MTASELQIQFKYKNALKENEILKNRYSQVCLEYKTFQNNQKNIIKKEVKNRTKELEFQHKQEIKEKDKIIADKDKQIEALKNELAHMASKLDNDSTNSGISTRKTPIGKKKYIPNTREKTVKSIGAQKGHKKHKLYAFDKSEATEIVEVYPEVCPNCGGKHIEQTGNCKDKCETDYEVKLIKRVYEFKEVECLDCHAKFSEKIPNNLKEENQYGPTVQSMSVCLTNEIYTPFNKTASLIRGITDGQINLSEGYIAKLQKRASDLLNPFIGELEAYIPKLPVYGWDEGVIQINKKEAILRTYCGGNVSLYYASDSKSKDSVKSDNILPMTSKKTIVMHDHNLISYDEKFQFENVECFIHLIRRLKKMNQDTKHEYLLKLVGLLKKANDDRNKLIEKEEESFSKEYIVTLHKNYKSLIEEGIKLNSEESIEKNYFKKEEKRLLNDLLKYEENYLKWAENFICPSTNNECERAIRSVKSKMNISGQFKNLDNAKYYATIRSYIQTCKLNDINIIYACKLLMNGTPLHLSDIIKEKND